jgi:hypothetical protein
MYQEYYEFTEVVNFGGCFETYEFCWFMFAFKANDEVYYYAEFFEFDFSNVDRNTPDTYTNRLNYTGIYEGFEYGGAGWMQEGGAYFYSFRLLEDVADANGVTRQVNGKEASVWTWANIGEAGSNFE